MTVVAYKFILEKIANKPNKLNLLLDLDHTLIHSLKKKKIFPIYRPFLCHFYC